MGYLSVSLWYVIFVYQKWFNIKKKLEKKLKKQYNEVLLIKFGNEVIHFWNTHVILSSLLRSTEGVELGAFPEILWYRDTLHAYNKFDIC